MNAVTSQHPTDAAITRQQRMLLLITTVAGHGIKHVFNAAFFILLPEIKAGLSLSNSQVGLLSSGRLALGGLANLPAGYVGDRYGRQRAGVLGTTLVLVGFFALLLGLATGYWTAVIAAALGNVAITFWHPTAIASLSRQFADRRGFAISLHGTGGSIGEALGPLLAGGLLTLFTWRVILQGSIVPAVVFGIVIWIILRGVPPQGEGVANMRLYARGLGRLVRNKRLLLVLLFGGGFAGGQGTVLTFFPIYLREGLEYSSFVVGVYLFLAQAAGIVVQPFMGHLSDRFSRKAVMVPSLVILGLADLALSVAPEGVPLALVVLVMGAFLFSLMSIVLASASDLVDPGAQATIVSMVFGAAVVVSAVLPSVAGRLADTYGLQITFVCAAAVVLAAAAIASISRWQVTD